MSIALQARVSELEARLQEFVQKQKEDSDLSLRVEKLEGEIRAMKARMGKSKE